MTKIRRDEIRRGVIVEDCAYHPVLCTKVTGDDVEGYSLFDASYPRSCSIIHCGLKVLTPEQVGYKIQRRERWLAAQKRWRESGGQDRSGYAQLQEEEDRDRP